MNPIHIHAEFVKSCVELDQCPKDRKPEYAFVGRSNVGKSSLINMLTQRKGLAKTSSTPGKTACINFFNVDESWYLVDLPGYGFAKRPKSQRDLYSTLIEKYITQRTTLINTFVLIDSRISPQEIDLMFMENMSEHQLPFAIIFTKSDKLRPPILEENIENYRKHLLLSWEELPPIFITSSNNHNGREEVLQYIQDINTIFHQQQ